MTDITPRASAPSVFSFESTSVRTFADDHGEPWFCAADVCAVLGYRNPSDAVAKHCRTPGVAKREMGVVTGKKANGEDAVQQVEQAFINEGNLYRLIIKSRKPEAERFETWVMEEVLPTIRKTGQYVAQPYAHNPGDALSLDQADTLRKLLTDAAKQRHPGDGKQQGAFLMRGWSKLKAHFKRGYREIPQAEFAEAVSLVARHIAEQGELIEEAPQPPADMVSKAHAMRCFDLAGALASATQQAAVRQLLDLDERDLRIGRFVFACNGDTPFVKRLEDDAVVLSWSEAPKLIATNDSAIDTATLQAIANAAIKRLTQRIPSTSSVFR